MLNSTTDCHTCKLVIIAAAQHNITLKLFDIPVVMVTGICVINLIKYTSTCSYQLDQL